MLNDMFSCCLYFSANRLSRIMSKLADEAFEKSGLSPSYAFILMLVEKHHSITPTELADNMGMMPSTITRLVDKLVAKDFVTRTTMGKKSCISLTQKGQTILSELNKYWENLYQSYVEVLGEDYSSELTRLTNEAAEALEKGKK